MNEDTRKHIVERNQKLIGAVIERARRDFPADIALIGGCGSYFRGDYHEKSDLDLIIVNNTDAGWGISTCFILDDTGFDIYCTPWRKLEKAATLESWAVSHLLDMQILYSAGPEHLERLELLREEARHLLAAPVDDRSLERASRNLDLARISLADMVLADGTGRKRYHAGRVMYGVINAICDLNNSYLSGSVSKQRDEVLGFRNVPESFARNYDSIVFARTDAEVTSSATDFLREAVRLYARLGEQIHAKRVPDKDNLKGTYEELWCNYRNKIDNAVRLGDAVYAYNAVLGAQDYYDEMERDKGTPHFELLDDFDAGNLGEMREAFMRTAAIYRAEYDKVGLRVLTYGSADEMRADYLGGGVAR